MPRGQDENPLTSRSSATRSHSFLARQYTMPHCTTCKKWIGTWYQESSWSWGRESKSERASLKETLQQALRTGSTPKLQPKLEPVAGGLRDQGLVPLPPAMTWTAGQTGLMKVCMRMGSIWQQQPPAGQASRRAGQGRAGQTAPSRDQNQTR
jgi:hypothetical protein